jgi:hypothetical protein
MSHEYACIWVPIYSNWHNALSVLRHITSVTKIPGQRLTIRRKLTRGWSHCKRAGKRDSLRFLLTGSPIPSPVSR